VVGLVQGAGSLLSSWQRKLDPGSLALKEKLLLALSVSAGGWLVIVTVGAVVSIVQV
jgi:hypothetical protein